MIQHTSTQLVKIWLSLVAFCLEWVIHVSSIKVYSLIADKFRDDSAAVFAIYKFVESMIVSAAYLYSNQLEMAYQLLILVSFCIFGTITFCCVELNHYKQNHQFVLPNENPKEKCLEEFR